jgi:hypothetical protein
MMETMLPRPSGLLPREDLPPAEREEMFALLSRHFAGVTREQFERDLADKNWVIQIRRDGRLLGFSTLSVRTQEIDGQMITALYSGDTIVDPSAWKSPTLSRAWIAAVNYLRSPDRRCYWLLLTSGFRTYRFLPVFWREFYPRYDAPFPPMEQKLLTYLARERYGADFHAESGIVRFPHPQTLRDGLREVPDGRNSDPHIAYFLARNPGHARGDELVCLTEISEANLTPAGRRMISTPSAE